VHARTVAPLPGGMGQLGTNRTAVTNLQARLDISLYVESVATTASRQHELRQSQRPRLQRSSLGTRTAAFRPQIQASPYFHSAFTIRGNALPCLDGPGTEGAKPTQIGVES
jgi:hypothetical protein